MNKNTGFKIGAVILLVAGFSALALGIQHFYIRKTMLVKPQVKIVDTVFKKPVYDKVLLGRFEALCKKYDTVSRNYTLSGMLNMNDFADTSARMKNVQFLFCKRGDEFYYRLGNTETINARGVYIYIDKIARHILVSAQRQVQYDQVSAMAGMGEKLQGEYYAMTDRRNGPLETIELTNEHHISCKQYAVTFDTLSNRMTHIFIRLSNPEQPARTDNEKMIDVSIDQWNNRGDLDTYLDGIKALKKENGQWKTTGRFATYQLTSM